MQCTYCDLVEYNISVINFVSLGHRGMRCLFQSWPFDNIAVSSIDYHYYYTNNKKENFIIISILYREPEEIVSIEIVDQINQNEVEIFRIFLQFNLLPVSNLIFNF